MPLIFEELHLLISQVEAQLQGSGIGPIWKGAAIHVRNQIQADSRTEPAVRKHRLVLGKRASDAYQGKLVLFGAWIEHNLNRYHQAWIRPAAFAPDCCRIETCFANKHTSNLTITGCYHILVQSSSPSISDGEGVGG